MQKVDLELNEMEWIKSKLEENHNPNTYGGYAEQFEGLYMKLVYAINREKNQIESNA
jgi:hypothetical protein